VCADIMRAIPRFDFEPKVGGRGPNDLSGTTAARHCQGDDSYINSPKSIGGMLRRAHWPASASSTATSAGPSRNSKSFERSCKESNIFIKPVESGLRFRRKMLNDVVLIIQVIGDRISAHSEILLFHSLLLHLSGGATMMPEPPDLRSQFSSRTVQHTREKICRFSVYKARSLLHDSFCQCSAPRRFRRGGTPQKFGFRFGLP
jgi:hypothetical protein